VLIKTNLLKIKNFLEKFFTSQLLSGIVLPPIMVLKPCSRLLINSARVCVHFVLSYFRHLCRFVPTGLCTKHTEPETSYRERNKNKEEKMVTYRCNVSSWLQCLVRTADCLLFVCVTLVLPSYAWLCWYWRAVLDIVYLASTAYANILCCINRCGQRILSLSWGGLNWYVVACPPQIAA